MIQGVIGTVIGTRHPLGPSLAARWYTAKPDDDIP
jgi:hypothetical protein